MDVEALSRRLCEQFPGRDSELDLLLSLLGEPEDSSPPGIFVYGPSATGKSTVVRELFAQYDPTGQQYAVINCVECFTSRLLFERVLNAWAGHVPSRENKYANLARCDTSVDFVSHARSLLKDRLDTHYIVLDQAERLRDRGPMLLTILLRLSELTGAQVSVVMISSVVWDKFRPRHGGAVDPIQVYFSYYTKQHILEILASDCPREEPREFFLTFVDAVYEVFHRNCVDLGELRHLVALLYPKFVQPVFEGQATRNEFARLFKLCQPYFVAATDKLYLREISTSEWQRNSVKASAKTSPDDITNSIYSMAEVGDGLDLPYYTKFLLVSAYLASYNPSRLDVQFFARGKGNSSKRRRHKTSATDSHGSSNRQQLLGPKSFGIERMLAIFYSIIPEPVDSSVDVQTQIASLITLRLLTKVSAGDRLDSINCKCNVSLETIRAVARSVRFEIDRFLHDFS